MLNHQLMESYPNYGWWFVLMNFPCYLLHRNLPEMQVSRKLARSL
jgi:hypothetical protein